MSVDREWIRQINCVDCGHDLQSARSQSMAQELIRPIRSFVWQQVLPTKWKSNRAKYAASKLIRIRNGCRVFGSRSAVEMEFQSNFSKLIVAHFLTEQRVRRLIGSVLQQVAQGPNVRLCHLQRLELGQFVFLANRRHHIAQLIERLVQPVHATSLACVGRQPSLLHHRRASRQRFLIRARWTLSSAAAASFFRRLFRRQLWSAVALGRCVGRLIETLAGVLVELQVHLVSVGAAVEAVARAVQLVRCGRIDPGGVVQEARIVRRIEAGRVRRTARKDRATLVGRRAIRAIRCHGHEIRHKLLIRCVHCCACESAHWPASIDGRVLTMPLIWFIVLARTPRLPSNWFISFSFDFFSTSLRLELCLCQLSPCSLFISLPDSSLNQRKKNENWLPYSALLCFDSMIETISCVISWMHCSPVGFDLLFARARALFVWPGDDYGYFTWFFMICGCDALTNHFEDWDPFGPHSVRFYWALNVN